MLIKVQSKKSFLSEITLLHINRKHKMGKQTNSNNTCPLTPLKNILHSLGKTWDTSSNYKTQFDTNDDMESFNIKFDFEKNDSATPSIHKIQTTECDWQEIHARITSLYSYLKKNKNTYSAHYLNKTAKTTAHMVIQTDHYQAHFKTANTTAPTPKDAKQLLTQAQKARDDFYNSFELSQTENMILMGLVGAVTGAITSFLAGPVFVASAAIGSVVGIGLVAARKFLFFGNTAVLNNYVVNIQKAIDKKLLPSSDPRHVTSNPIDPNRCIATHEDVTQGLQFKSKLDLELELKLEVDEDEEQNDASKQCFSWLPFSVCRR